MVKRLARIEMVCEKPQALANFYRDAFGFLESDIGEDFTSGVRRTVRMRLGNQEIALLGVDPLGRRYPVSVAGWNPLFQHIAIVATDISNAYERLSTVPGWSPISTAGPQLLPAASGGVRAFKFRDPEGHPLELITFAPDAIPTRWQICSDNCCLGIDHSAVSVADTQRSIAFYQDLGLNCTAGSLNIGPEQEKLDDVQNPVVEVTALTPPQSEPHLELLCYRGGFDRNVKQNTNDVTATRLVFSVENRDELKMLCASNLDNLVISAAEGEGCRQRVFLCDPDGHLICLEC